MNSARQIAIDILNSVRQGGHTLDFWMENSDALIDGLPRSDRALVHALVFGVLRWQGRLDWIIDQLAVRSPKSIDPMVRTILRLGLFQLYHLDRIPASAAVNTSVELVKRNQRPWAAGFVNKLLRRAATEPSWSTRIDRIADPIEALAIRHAFPTWMISRWVNRWGVEQTCQLCEVVNDVPTMSLRTNTLKTTRAQLQTTIRDDAEQVAASLLTEEGIVVARLLRPLTQWPAFRDGWFQVQDESSQMVGHLLAPDWTHLVWDACAGLGTKTGHLAQIMGNRGRILASDIQTGKLQYLKKEFKRLGITNTFPCTIDVQHGMPLKTGLLFDRILVDAPCSGLGVLQKNPDGKWNSNAEELQRHRQRQLQILKQAAPFLRPGGRLVYSVCSFESEETEMVMEEFLHDHPQFDIEPTVIAETMAAAGISSSEPYLTILPQRHRFDGFFAAVLTRR